MLIDNLELQELTTYERVLVKNGNQPLKVIRKFD